MAVRSIKLPDVGEGVAEAELVEWHVEVGDIVREDMVLAAVMTGKATVEIPSPVEGEVVWRHGYVGDIIATGTVILKIRVSDNAGDEATGNVVSGEPETVEIERKISTVADGFMLPKSPSQLDAPVRSTGVSRATGERPLAAPAVRLRAREAGIDLRQVAGNGPAGRITHDDLDAFLQHGKRQPEQTSRQPNTSIHEVKVVGLRRRIAEHMALSKSRIPHITYVEEVDMTGIEELRTNLNAGRRAEQPKLTILPFLMQAIVKAVSDQPMVNALFDDEAGIIRQYGGVHVGIATQTRAGLVVPVVKHVEGRDLYSCAGELLRLSEAARKGTAQREELSGSTITISSLGAMGGIVSTPVINHPEVAVIGVNKIAVRPQWDGTQFVPRKMMNLSSSFDHRVIDGWDAATFIQRLKQLLESPAMIFVEG